MNTRTYASGSGQAGQDTPSLLTIDTTRDQDVDFVDGIKAAMRRKTTKPGHLDTLKEVIDIIALIEKVLERDFGGRGRGVHSKLDSLTHPVPSWLDKRLRYLAAVRNKAVTEPWWPIPDREQYLGECHAAAALLLEIVDDRTHPAGRLVQALRCLGWSMPDAQKAGLAIATILALSTLLAFLATGF